MISTRSHALRTALSGVAVALLLAMGAAASSPLARAQNGGTSPRIAVSMSLCRSQHVADYERLCGADREREAPASTTRAPPSRFADFYSKLTSH